MKKARRETVTAPLVQQRDDGTWERLKIGTLADAAPSYEVYEPPQQAPGCAARGETEMQHQDAVKCGIIEKTDRCLEHPSAHTGNLMMAGCGNVIVSHFAPPASMHNGGTSMSFRTCPQCGQEFRPNNSKHTWCSVRCSFSGRAVSIEDRFWAKVQKTDTCWLWTASLRNKGYGAFTYTDADGRVIQDRAHRFSYRLHIGEIPPGLFVLHRCDTPACVNPAHLFLGTNADNVHDMIAKGRAGKPGPDAQWARGEAHHAARFTEQQIRDIRARYAAGGISYSQLGRLYDACGGTIAKIVLRYRWRHVQ